MLEVSSVSYTSWSGSTRETTIRKNFHYDEGNDITRIEHYSQLFYLYSASGSTQAVGKVLGANVDLKA